MLRNRILRATVAIWLVVCAAAARPAAYSPDVPPGTVKGTVWDAHNQGVPSVRVRLRNLQTGRVDAETSSDDVGDFMFPDLSGKDYVVEAVDQTDLVIAVGPIFVAVPGETVRTYVRLAPRRQPFAGMFHSLAAAAVASAAALGVTAIGPTGQAVSGAR